jgi:hypothetical protein
MNTITSNKSVWRVLGPWLGLGCVLAGFVIAVIRLHPTNFFGYTEDDSIYFSSAKALAEGKGYVLASFPGTPAATKYPVFYPWLLSWVWRWNPTFPANLVDAIAINVAFAIGFILLAFLFLRRFGAGKVEALILTGFCAFHPVILFYTGNLLSEIPFATMALGALLLSEKIAENPSLSATSVCCGVLVGMCMLTRVLGVPVAAGVALGLLARRAWRPLLLFCASLAPFFTALAWETVRARRMVPSVGGIAASSPMWLHTWTYYTSYLNVWKEGIPNLATFFMMLKGNITVLLLSPATYVLSPLVQVNTVWGAALMAIVAAVGLAGIVREIRKHGLRPVHFALSLYACVILIWSYPDANRFLIPFLPLFALAMWMEGKHVMRMSYLALRSGPSLEKAVAAGMSVATAIAVGAVIANYAGKGRRDLVDVSTERGRLLPEKRQAYEWISRVAAPSSRAIAYDDAMLYLYTGRQATRPFTFTAAEFYSPALLDRDLSHMMDVPAAVQAQYWVYSDDDLRFEWHDAYLKGRARMSALSRDFPLVFRSDAGNVRIYSIHPLQTSDAPTFLSTDSPYPKGTHPRE